MSRYRGPRLKIVRRLGDLPGFTNKIQKRQASTQNKGKKTAKKRLSQYSIRLQEKQKLRYNYGVTERQLLLYVRKARRIKGSTGQILLQQLEMRLDNIIYRLGMAPTIANARQLVNHGHIVVNDRIVTIPSYRCKPKDIISVRNNSTSRNVITNNLSFSDSRLPPHLSFKKESLVALVNGLVDRQWIPLNINELLVVEYYSRMA
uniref:Small ribosomal subunit protein uS4c n=1 Tax=Chlorokybus atmophyticus TaxID=3144 RepID=RR4_CHLAT|nr:ribosomal protein S4 [Chlorokybus atmophyticus]Q19VA6.2 RecName: Full=Small ribosomal subunit protein uS4c; AltName: Full=30S ribosomal protein S4, chloroplastic [Chlorokybus atmophyticus]ABD62252.2 ribosomal protein S4 [Chlorokybus atmophyticus]WKT05640.1 ribosomal protein S4 [Chlorokybus atmophyticus]